eukprot:m.75373 g.75373  ORF g.75373 m.75373 type:complete len:113 (-) comp12497_c0_seq2:8-346(-)
MSETRLNNWDVRVAILVIPLLGVGFLAYVAFPLIKKTRWVIQKSRFNRMYDVEMEGSLPGWMHKIVQEEVLNSHNQGLRWRKDRLAWFKAKKVCNSSSFDCLSQSLHRKRKP